MPQKIPLTPKEDNLTLPSLLYAVLVDALNPLQPPPNRVTQV